MNDLPVILRSSLIVFISLLLGSLLLSVLISSAGLGLLTDISLYVNCLIFSLIVTVIVTLALIFRCLKGLILLVVFSFLYIPMIILVVYSFNSSRLVTVWAEFSTKWYFELMHNEELFKAVGLSLAIAACAATFATVLGTLASYAIVRFKRFKGANLFSFMTTAPLVMPDIITGLALLLLFVGMGQILGWPKDRGAITIWMAHTTFCMAYVTVVISARLRELDKSIEEAALDLGANPLKVFFIITLPMIAPALISGWLLAFTLSLDDVVIANFVTGPGAMTLPKLIFSKVKLGVDPQVNALATIILLIVGIIGFISWLWMRKTERRKISETRMH
ncbi:MULTISPECIES: ABC transporter permease subunit [unclassified Gilliamella]|uniref:ABC transporter permease subunit n=1 Tax=unclassified Gilliamella TaxID=2685620 RepID=UPI0019215E41|nr:MULTISPECIES: ABC transporter permease subunit [unclassified Gilliamella]